MNKNFMQGLKNEIKIIEKSIHDTGDFPYSVLSPWLSYMVILIDGTKFYLDSMTIKFPEFDYDDIELIVKRDCSYCEDQEKFYDSEIGLYFADFPKTYDLKVTKFIMTGEED